MWDKLRAALSRFKLNQMELERDDSAGSALRRMGEILAAPSPYELVKEAEGLIRTVSEVNEKLLSERGEHRRLQQSPNKSPAVECGDPDSGWRRIVENNVPHATGESGETGFNPR